MITFNLNNINKKLYVFGCVLGEKMGKRDFGKSRTTTFTSLFQDKLNAQFTSQNFLIDLLF